MSESHDLTPGAETTFRYGGAAGRRTILLQRLGRSGYVSFAVLGRELAVSDRTVRRDLTDMADQGIVTLLPGGATLAGAPAAGRAATYGPGMTELRAKQAIARRAAELVAPGDSVALDAGTTICCLAEELARRGDFSVITSSLPVLAAFAERAASEVICVGGTYDHVRRAYLGPMAVDNMRGLRAGTAFIATSGVDATHVTCATQNDAELKRSLMASAAVRVLVATASVLTRTSPVVFAEIAEFDHVITDESASREVLESLASTARLLSVVGL